ncbi:hypothetical protein FJ651_00250 [Paucihalobacter ruber]|uniref:Uncharacterized protein n=1 Tax=Paucihalobacter ruber TaxID=2567861 RepID=A0A506PQ78_9FLAO|nr:DUF6090 family protein [Paucihalobacter ruber]TPV35387.1 hypothetical protein FJ651_00250 [Paucihalobacter ruber]
MIKFFRHIRQTLIEQGKMGKYFKYAIGEIVLVVVGILLALSINNWNQERILNNENQVILRNLNEEFSENLIQLESSISDFDRIIKALDELLTVMRTQDGKLTDVEFDRLLNKTFFTPNWTPSSFVLVELKNSGALSKLKNNNLKTLLFKWEREFDKMKRSNEGYARYGFDYIEFITKNGSVRNLDALSELTKNLQRSTIAVNNPELLKIPEFENRADNFYFLAISLRGHFQSLREIMIDIIENSKTDLNK